MHHAFFRIFSPMLAMQFPYIPVMNILVIWALIQLVLPLLVTLMGGWRNQYLHMHCWDLAFWGIICWLLILNIWIVSVTFLYLSFFLSLSSLCSFLFLFYLYTFCVVLVWVQRQGFWSEWKRCVLGRVLASNNKKNLSFCLKLWIDCSYFTFESFL